ncbi:class I glutamine amidotransferase-like protein [Westerdykella ornata]|uniref:D-lactate dehydratase n=1 Tax=Westerdykella ornata TaxID=318751 RepID=A0A6A6JG67_WESOR|nr:class I glutamine amidotransferase-like protein [Westerdykella ornata]KAF2275214.1 class I glutamine amidotransferase-like protein [Westerdykella ornata]
MAPKILVVLTSHNKLGNLDKPTGWYLPELAHPYHILRNKADITVASPKGGEAPLDPASIEAAKDDVSVNFLKNDEQVWKNTQKLETFVGKAKDFDAIFYVGGHGPMFDLADNPTSQQLIREFWEAGKIVAAVCHAPAVLYNVKLSDGSLLVAGKEVTAFTNAEEEQMGLSKAVPFLPEDALQKASGGRFVKAAELWGEKVVVQGRLITGQNPASATGVGKAIAKALGIDSGSS